MDKQKAKEWFSYGMVVGDPYCALAYLMYFVDLSLDDELRREPKLATIYSILLNTFLIAYNENAYLWQISFHLIVLLTVAKLFKKFRSTTCYLLLIIYDTKY